MCTSEPAIIERWDGGDLEFCGDFDLNSDFDKDSVSSKHHCFRIPFENKKSSPQPPASYSEDEDLDSVFPGEETRDLSNRLWTRHAELVLKSSQAQKAPLDEFFADLDIDGGKVFEFESAKARININIKRTLTSIRRSHNTDPYAATPSRIPLPRSAHKTPPSFHHPPAEYKDLSKKPSLISIRPQSAEKQLAPKNSMPSLRSTVVLKPPARSIGARSVTPHTGRSSSSVQVNRPFLPGGKSALSHHISTKRASTMSSRSIHSSQSKLSLAPDSLRREAAGVRMLTKPRRPRNFGNGTELDAFDDLPTCVPDENKYRVVTPKSPRLGRIKSSFGRIKEKDIQAASSPPPPKMRTSNKLFSRVADRLLPKRNSLSPSSSSFSSSREPSKTIKKMPKKLPTLFQNIDSANLSKVHGRMKYNPATYKWEGNDSVLDKFSPTSPTSRPALISNISNATKNVQVVGNMVFDPSRMCWLKNNSQDSDSDPFEGMDDLVENNEMKISLGNFEFVVGEEFDVGPEFIRRQREEEEIWRRVVDGWVSGERRGRDHLWDIREVLDHPSQPTWTDF
ncbi:Protein byr4 [Neolecta irregularis DAH-3]|uniref:Protein byr4 n=1 Tax=Neolecta irregularis (strain DAH-3) TaxID=1198029 RepID=A0A1U7LP94_NEOID|nr:Protein byr4 [Neolecta irregularis DAH-3]|eukprot:OLL24448.1 Protein byr4 [Neolecta irregularis DAH-3]